MTKKFITQYCIYLKSSFLILFISISSLQNHSHANENLTLAVHPYLPHDELIKKFTPLVQYLSQSIGKKINLKIGSSYEEHVKYIGQNKVDIAYIGPASYVKMLSDYGSKPILARLEINGTPWFHGNIIVNKNSNIKKLEDLKGKHIAYGDPSSTMSFIVPHYMLTNAGVFDDPLTRYTFLHNHTNVALSIIAGDFYAGAVKSNVFKKYQKQNLISIAQTPDISEHIFITKSNLSPEIITSIRSAMLNINTSKNGLKALKIIKNSATGLVSASEDDYKNLQHIIKLLDNNQ